MLRDACKDDFKILCDIENKCFIHPFNEEQMHYEMFSNPVSQYLVFELNGVVIGFIDYWVTFDSSTITQIAVLPLYRRHGFAQELLSEAMNDCKAKKAMTMTLEVRKSNVAAISLYHKNGFKLITTKPHYYTDGEDALYMVKEL